MRAVRSAVEDGVLLIGRIRKRNHFLGANKQIAENARVPRGLNMSRKLRERNMGRTISDAEQRQNL
jgi:hypothetical protein